MGIQEEALKLHEEWQGKLSIDSKVLVKNKHDLSMAYTPGVAEPCRMIHKNKDDIYQVYRKIWWRWLLTGRQSWGWVTLARKPPFR